MTLQSVRDACDEIERDWSRADNSAQLKRDIDSLEVMLKELETVGDESAEVMWDKVNDLQGRLRLRLSGKHPRRPPTGTALSTPVAAPTFSAAKVPGPR